MAGDTDNLVKNTLAKVADYVRDVATMTVQTEYTRVGAAEGVNVADDAMLPLPPRGGTDVGRSRVYAHDEEGAG